MALADSGRAIGAVTRLLQDHLVRRGFNVSVGKPEAAAASDTSEKLNLFLYETGVDASLRNVSLQEDEPPPLWLQLRYVMTAFDAGEDSDSADAHELLGRGLAAVTELNFLRLDDAVPLPVRLALENSPEPLKVTLEETPADLVSKLMGGTDERYRLSASFEVRPVMIVPAEPSSFPRLVGVDYTQTPPEEVGEEGVALTVIPTLGPRITALEPAAFEPGAEIAVRGDDLHLGGLEAVLGGTVLSVVAQTPDRATVRVEGPFSAPATEGPVASGASLSAGEHPLSLRLPLAGGRFRASNALLGRLLPVVTSASLSGTGDLTVEGTLLGTWDDDVLVALASGGSVARLFQAGPEPPPPPADGTVVPSADQHTLTVADATDGVDPGDYRVVVRVNGQQARVSPPLTVPAP